MSQYRERIFRTLSKHLTWFHNADFLKLCKHFYAILQSWKSAAMKS